MSETQVGMFRKEGEGATMRKWMLLLGCGMLVLGTGCTYGSFSAGVGYNDGPYYAPPPVIVREVAPPPVVHVVPAPRGHWHGPRHGHWHGHRKGHGHWNDRGPRHGHHGRGHGGGRGHGHGHGRR